MPEPTLDLAKEALKYVRSWGWTSTNKRGLCGPKSERQKRAATQKKSLNKAMEYLKHLWIMPNDSGYDPRKLYVQKNQLEALKVLTVLPLAAPDNRTSADRAVAGASLAALYGVGNCEDMANMAFAYLVASDVKPVAVAGLCRADHAFVVLGRESYAGEVIKVPVENWGHGVFICDPWANIACPAKNYKVAWQQKMGSWATKRKEIKIDKNWISPLNQDWIGAIERSDVDIVAAYPERRSNRNGTGSTSSSEESDYEV